MEHGLLFLLMVQEKKMADVFLYLKIIIKNNCIYTRTHKSNTH
jgi:hypothetical protein